MSLRERLRHLTLFGILNVAAVPGVLRLVAVVAVVVALGWAWVRGGRHGRFWAAVSVVTCLAVLIAPDYYDQYGASVAPQIAIVLAAGAVASIEYLRRYRDVIAGLGLEFEAARHRVVDPLCDDRHGRLQLSELCSEEHEECHG
jgi:hypothetical protein